MLRRAELRLRYAGYRRMCLADEKGLVIGSAAHHGSYFSSPIPLPAIDKTQQLCKHGKRTPKSRARSSSTTRMICPAPDIASPLTQRRSAGSNNAALSGSMSAWQTLLTGRIFGGLNQCPWSNWRPPSESCLVLRPHARQITPTKLVSHSSRVVQLAREPAWRN